MGILENSRLLKKVGNREFPGNGNSRKSLKEPSESRGKSTFFRENLTFPRETLKKKTEFPKLAVHFPSGIPDEISRESGSGIPAPKQSGSA